MRTGSPVVAAKEAIVFTHVQLQNESLF